MSDAKNPERLTAAPVLDRIIKSIHDHAQAKGEYRAKREDESWFDWWQAYQHDVMGEEFNPYFEESRP